MKLIKLIVLILLCFISCHGYCKNNKRFRRYDKEQTYLRYLNKKVILSKINSPHPKWMIDQINEDFKEFEGGISLESIDDTFFQIMKGVSNYIVRYRIIDGKLYRYFPEGEIISLKDNSTELAIKTLLRCSKFPDLDFILSYLDGVGPWDTYYLAHQQAPLFCSAKIKNITPFVVLIPDWRSIGEWWILNIRDILMRSKKFPWEKKISFSLWRGSLTKESRINICRLAKDYPEYLDAKINKPYVIPEPLRRKLEEEGLIGDDVSWEEFLKCKYLPYMDGVMCASPALQWRLLSNSVTIKPKSDEIQWFYRALEPNVHFLEVKSDLSDLIATLDWAKNHDQECKQIAQEARSFVLKNLLYEDVLLYFYLVLNKYSFLQKIEFQNIKSLTLSDPHWVNIHDRRILKRIATDRSMQGYCENATPF